MKDKLPQEFIPLKPDYNPLNDVMQNLLPQQPMPKFDKPIQEVIVKPTHQKGLEGFLDRHKGKIALAALILAIIAIIQTAVIAYSEK